MTRKYNIKTQGLITSTSSSSLSRIIISTALLKYKELNSQFTNLFLLYTAYIHHQEELQGNYNRIFLKNINLHQRLSATVTLLVSCYISVMTSTPFSLILILLDFLIFLLFTMILSDFSRCCVAYHP